MDAYLQWSLPSLPYWLVSYFRDASFHHWMRSEQDLQMTRKTTAQYFDRIHDTDGFAYFVVVRNGVALFKIRSSILFVLSNPWYRGQVCFSGRSKRSLACQLVEFTRRQFGSVIRVWIKIFNSPFYRIWNVHIIWETTKANQQQRSAWIVKLLIAIWLRSLSY